MRKGSTSFGARKVRCWRWLFGNKIPVSRLVANRSTVPPPSVFPMHLDPLHPLWQLSPSGSFRRTLISAVESWVQLVPSNVDLRPSNWRSCFITNNEEPGCRGKELEFSPGLEEGKYKAIWKREFKLPWCKAGLPKSSRRFSGFGPVGSQRITSSLCSC